MNPGAWVTGGDGICRMRWVYRGEPHLVCVDCEGPLLDKPGAEELEA